MKFKGEFPKMFIKEHLLLILYSLRKILFDVNFFYNNPIYPIPIYSNEKTKIKQKKKIKERERERERERESHLLPRVLYSHSFILCKGTRFPV
jgi:hypothetical protein